MNGSGWMQKGMFLGIGLGILLPFSVLASADTSSVSESEEMSWVFDDYGLLDDTEQEELNQELEDIYDEYGYDAVLLISPDVGEDQDYRKYATEFMQENDIGAGDTHEGMCIFHQPDARNITIVFRGETQDDFSESVQDKMLNKCKKYLKAEDPVSGYQSLIADLRTGLDRISEGKSVRLMDVSERPYAVQFLINLVLCFLVMAVPTGLMTWLQVRKMKTRMPQANANAYTADGGLDLCEKRDLFLYSTVSRTAKPKKDDKNDGSSGSFSSGGESFSGSSSNY